MLDVTFCLIQLPIPEKSAIYEERVAKKNKASVIWSESFGRSRIRQSPTRGSPGLGVNLAVATHTPKTHTAKLCDDCYQAIERRCVPMLPSLGWDSRLQPMSIRLRAW
jgi:hypothetical protein